jgi:methionine-rich copper-binding protein CopC
MKMPGRDRPQKAVKGFLLALCTAAFLMLPAIAAHAHATLQSSDPANGSVVADVPAQIGLTFDHTPLALGSVIRVEDATGTDRADGPVAVVDNHVTQAIKAGAPESQYTVTWRVASSDGHAIEGTFAFTAGTANATTGASVSAVPAGTTTDTGAGVPTGMIVAGAVALLLIIALARLALAVKRRLSYLET